jgi:hypothetical protein
MRIHILNFRVDDSPLGDDLRFYLNIVSGSMR